MNRILSSCRVVHVLPRLLTQRLACRYSANIGPGYYRPLGTTPPTHMSNDQSSPHHRSDDNRHRARMYSITSGALCALFGASYILYLQLKTRAEEAAPAIESNLEIEGEEEVEKPKSHVSFHDRSVMAYEDRIRAYSTPDKIFRYFATLRIKEGNDKGIYMTPNDFIRSITPGTMQPQEYGLDLFRTVSMETVNKEGLGLVDDPNSVFNRLGHSGLISFSDYLFLLTILATPMKHFEMAFKMFDLNGDGEVEYDEFETVQAVLLNATPVGTRHRDHVINGNVASSVDGALAEHFFGPNKDRKLTIDKFQEFHQRLNTEIMAMEFNRYNPVGGAISERDFAHMIVSHASLSKQKKKQMVQRAKKEYGSQPNPGISFNDVLMFDMLMGCLSDVDTALGMYYSAGTSITPAELKQACRAAIGSDISEHLIDVLFTLFDTNDDGELSRKEFVYVLMSRNSHGLQKSRELGFAKLVNAVMTCSGKTVKSQFEHLA